MGGDWDTAQTAGMVGFVLFVTFSCSAVHQLALYIYCQSLSGDYNVWHNKALFLGNISLWAVLESCYYFGKDSRP